MNTYKVSITGYQLAEDAGTAKMEYVRAVTGKNYLSDDKGTVHTELVGGIDGAIRAIEIRAKPMGGINIPKPDAISNIPHKILDANNKPVYLPNRCDHIHPNTEMRCRGDKGHPGNHYDVNGNNWAPVAKMPDKCHERAPHLQVQCAKPAKHLDEHEAYSKTHVERWTKNDGGVTGGVERRECRSPYCECDNGFCKNGHADMRGLVGHPATVAAQKGLNEQYNRLLDACVNGAQPQLHVEDNSEILEDLTIRELQTQLPWTTHYHRDFRSNPQTHKDFQHALIHVMKSIGRISAKINDAEHKGFDWELDTDVPKWVADLVVCALRMANTYPGMIIDLQHAVQARINESNNTKLRGPQ